MITIDQLLTLPTQDQIFAQMITWLVNMGLPADKWRKGGVARSILYVVAGSFVVLGTLITLIAQSSFLSTAQGVWLTIVAREVYGVQRVAATFASGVINATNAGATIFTWTPGQLVVQNATTKKAFANTGTIVLNPGDTNIPIAVQAIEQGTDSNSASGLVTLLFTSAPGVTITNPLPIFGVDEQNDDDLRLLCIAKLGSLSFLGPRGAYQYAIKTALEPSGAPVNINREFVSPSSSTGIVTVYVASPSGAASGTDLTAVEDSIEAIARPDTVTVNVNNVTTVDYAFPLTVWVKSRQGLDATVLHDQILTALANLVSTYPIGGMPKPPSSQGYLYDEFVRGAAQSVDPGIYAVDSTGGADVALSASQVATISSTVTVRVITTGATS